MSLPLRELLAGIVDYAGLFPPAGLGLAAVVENFRGYSAGPQAWMLGRLVLPFAQLAALRPLLGPEERWELSLLAGHDPAAEASALRAWEGGLRAASLEIRAQRPEQIRELSGVYPAQQEIFFEVDAGPGQDALLEAIAASGRFAKLRSGGVEPEGIPPIERVADFLIACNALRLPFKATAGLHHPVRAEHALRYEADAPRAVMHGFLNVFVGAALLHAGQLDRTGLLECLGESDPGRFTCTETAAGWRGRVLDGDGIARGRRFARSFGSCSFEEPIDDLRQLGWLQR